MVIGVWWKQSNLLRITYYVLTLRINETTPAAISQHKGKATIGERLINLAAVCRYHQQNSESTV